MSDVNNVVLIGRLVRDAGLEHTSSGKPVAKFSLAVNERRKVGGEWKDAASFFEIALWGQLGESLNRHLSKGRRIAVAGRLAQERWEQDGASRQKVFVVAETVQLLEYPSGDNGDSEKARGPSAPPPANDGFPDDIPF
jgi:single-strand DNA-binding protein